MSAEMSKGSIAVVPLAASRLGRLPAGVSGPTYDRDAVEVGIVHVGVGGFHRAHQAVYVDALLNAGQAHDWGICGVGVLAQDRSIHAALRRQDHLYTVIEKHPDGRYDARVIGSILGSLRAADGAEALIRRLADASTRIVSLTITEGGYAIDDVTGRFDPEAPGVASDLVAGAAPTTVFGYVVAALQRRRQAGIAPFTIMSCDNLPGNGAQAREAFSAFGELREPGLGAWIENEVRFPSSMVDRITPATTPADRTEVATRFGIADACPVVCEPFTQWVLEDSFGLSRPPLEDVGVQLVADVAPYELMKLRLLNGSHQCLAYFGRLCGYEHVHEAAQDPLFRRFLRAYMDEEARPSLGPVPGVDLASYTDGLIERFSNGEIRDTIARLCAETSDRIPKWLLPVVRFQLAADGPIACCAAVVASWARYAEGVDEDGRPIDVVDRRRDDLTARARSHATDPTAFLASPDLFGDLSTNERFVTAYVAALDSLHERGARRTLEALVDGALR